MTLTPLSGLANPDAADTGLVAPVVSGAGSFAGALSRAFDAAGGALERADRSEHAFVRGAGGLQEMVLDRAQADIALSIATTAASRVTQALSTILGMQV